MPRTKGSKNKKSTVETAVELTVEQFEEKISQVNAEIEKLGADLKAKKAELKRLLKSKKAAVAAQAEKKAEEDKKAIMDAIAASGKSIEEVLELLK